MGKLAEAYVDVSTRLGGLDSGLADARGRLARFVGAGNSALAGLGVGLAGAGIGAALLSAAKAAADLGETLSKVGVVFGSSSGQVVAQADDLAQKFGLVKSVSLDAAANLGLVTQASGLTKEASAGLSNRLVKLAADASSFYNVGFDVALEKIRSALVGEAEPIRSFGVLLSEAAVTNEALAMGLIKSSKEMTEQAKVAARASLIFKQMSAATGDLERTQDSATNQMRKLNGEIENLKADFGKSLIDPLQQAIKLARELGDALGKAVGSENAGGLGKELNANLIAYRAILGGAKEGADPAKSTTAAMGGGFFGAIGGALNAAFFPDAAKTNELAGVSDSAPNNEVLALRQKTDARRKAEMVDATAGIFDRWADGDAAKPANRPGADLNVVQIEDALVGAFTQAIGKAASGAFGKAASGAFGKGPAAPEIAEPGAEVAAQYKKELAFLRGEEQAALDKENADAAQQRRGSWGGVTSGEDFWKQTQERLLQDDLPKKQLDEAKLQTKALGASNAHLQRIAEANKKSSSATVAGPE